MKSRTNPLLRLSSLLAATIAINTSAHAVDYTWGGGDGNWNSANWNPGPVGGPTTAGNTATINSGTVWANVGVGALDSVNVGVGGTLGFWNGAYQGIGNNLNLQGGTVIGNNNYNAYGASILGNVTVSGSAASTITGGSWFNLFSSTTFTVADVTGDSASDLLVNISLRSMPASWWDGAYEYNSKIIKEGAGTMEVTVHSYFNGGLDLNGGTLKVSNGNSGYGYFSGAVNVNAGTTLSIASDGTGFGYQNGWKPSSVNINGGTVTGTGGNHVWGISGGVNMTGGTFESAAFQWNYTDLNTNASADTATINGPLNLRGDAGYTGLSANVADGAAATDLLISGDITELYGALGITKSGAGTMKLTGTSSYTGATNINAGKLIIDGNNSSATGAVTVASGATLGGSGTVGGATTIQSGGHLAVGNSPGTQTFSSTLTFDSGSIFDWELNADTADTGSSNQGTYDKVIANGAVTGTSAFTIALGTNAFTDAFWNTNKSWTDIFSGSGSFDLSSIFTTFDGAGVASSGLVAGQGQFSFTSNTLNWTAVPEPTSALAGLLITAGLLRRRRAVG